MVLSTPLWLVKELSVGRASLLHTALSSLGALEGRRLPTGGQKTTHGAPLTLNRDASSHQFPPKSDMRRHTIWAHHQVTLCSFHVPGAGWGLRPNFKPSHPELG